MSNNLRPAAAAVALLMIAAVGLATGAHADPFGAGMAPPRAADLPSFGGLTGWILIQEASFYRALSGTIRAAADNGAAVLTLLGLSFAYGIFHAAGPGHGKAVISSYLVANEETWRRGIVLSLASALLQALTAVIIVTTAVLLLEATAKAMGDTIRFVETASYLAIVTLGLRLVWQKGRGLAALLQTRVTAPVLAPAGATFAAMEVSAHHHHAVHGHQHAHHHDESCGCDHGPDPSKIVGNGGWRRGLAAVLAVGLRPCSGAILVLVFAFTQGLFAAGIGAAFVMGLGTAVTVAAIATFAVFVRARRGGWRAGKMASARWHCGDSNSPPRCYSSSSVCSCSWAT